MIDIEEFKRYLETEKGKARMQKFIDNFKKSERIKQNKIKLILEHDDYISWLKTFTMKYPDFSDDEWLYFPSEISKNDNENVNDLNLLYEVVENYANKNYIEPTLCDFGNYYSIKHNNIGYDIGILISQGTLFFCRRCDEDKYFIEFRDIQTNKVQPHTNLINQKLEELTSLINNMIEDDIPAEVISTHTKKVLQKVQKSSNNSHHN